jgi:hypothetical protein
MDSDFKKEYTDFYNEQVDVFGRTPEEVDPEGIMKDFSNPDYLNDVLGFIDCYGLRSWSF